MPPTAALTAIPPQTNRDILPKQACAEADLPDDSIPYQVGMR